MTRECAPTCAPQLVAFCSPECEEESAWVDALWPVFLAAQSGAAVWLPPPHLMNGGTS